MAIYKRGNIWWYKFSKDGRPYYKSSESTDRIEAERLLKIAQGDVAKGKTPMVVFNQVVLDDLADDFLADFKINKQKTLDHAERYVRELKNYFGNIRVTRITTAKIRQYILKRQDEGLANGSINRELSALKRMFSLGAQADPPKIDRIPKIPMLTENNVRKGFFEYDEYLALHQTLPDYLKPVLAFGYFSGWRISEILNLKWPQVDLEQGKAWIPPGETKNKEGREIYLGPELQDRLRVLKAKRNPPCPYVFQREGQKIKRFSKAWKTACIHAGLSEPLMDAEGNIVKTKRGKIIEAPTKIFHDLRRTAVRENVRAGIPAGVAMKISGHKTMSVFERYNITDEKDLKRAADMRRLRIQIQGGDNRGDNWGNSGVGSQPTYQPNHSESLDNAPVAQVDRARDS